MSNATATITESMAKSLPKFPWSVDLPKKIVQTDSEIRLNIFISFITFSVSRFTFLNIDVNSEGVKVVHPFLEVEKNNLRSDWNRQKWEIIITFIF